MSSAEASRPRRVADRAWLALTLLTLTTSGFGEAGLGGGLVAALLLGIAFVKGRLVVHHFMELKNVRLPWRLVMEGWLLLVLGGIGLAYWLGSG
jgi:hypothetical protein